MITAIKREFNLYPNIVGIVTTDDLTVITTPDYFFGTQSDDVDLLNNGVWEWEIEDIVLIYYATNQIGWFTYDATTDAFVALADVGLSSTLPSGYVFVGNASNVATGVAMSGDVAISNAGATTIQAGAVTASKIANNTITAAQLANTVFAVQTTTLTNTQLLDLYSTPQLIVTAPGSGKIAILRFYTIDYAYSTASTASGGLITAQYGNTAHAGGIICTQGIPAATLNGLSASGQLCDWGSPFGGANTAVENVGIYLSNATGLFTTGAGTATIYAFYQVLTPA